MWVGNYDGVRSATVLASSKARAMRVVGCGRKTFEDHYVEQPGTRVDAAVDAGLAVDTLHLASLAEARAAALAQPSPASPPALPAGCRWCAIGLPFRSYRTSAGKRVHLSSDRTHAVGECEGSLDQPAYRTGWVRWEDLPPGRLTCAWLTSDLRVTIVVVDDRAPRNQRAGWLCPLPPEPPL